MDCYSLARESRSQVDHDFADGRKRPGFHHRYRVAGGTVARGIHRGRLDWATNAQPQVVNVPVTLVVGASASVSIGGLVNNWSGATTAAPGMMTAVYGTQMAPAGT